MPYEVRRRQHYAVSKDRVLTHIREAHESKEDFFCLNCGCRMIKKCGKIRDWHFAHNSSDKRNCSYETYIHKYAKLRLKKWFDESDSIMLCYNVKHKCELFQKCVFNSLKKNLSCAKLEKRSFNLKTCLDICEVEELVNLNGRMFRPDLLWRDSTNPNNSIFIEIKVTHESTDIKKESGARIIEFEVHSEEDIDKIINQDIRESNSTHFHGFNFVVQASDNFKFKPLYQLKKFRLYGTGRVYLDSYSTTCQNYLERNRSSLFELTFDNSEMGEKQLFIFGLIQAINNGFVIRNCYICKHKKFDKSQNQYCCLKKLTNIMNCNDAVKCAQFEYIRNRFQYGGMSPKIIDKWVKSTEN